MGFQDVAFPPSRASFSTTFSNNCGSGESLRAITCLRTVVGVRQGHAPCGILLVQLSLLLCLLLISWTS